MHFATNLNFTDEDNKVIGSSQAASAGTLKAMPIGLSSAKIAYSGMEFPFKKLLLTKNVFMGERFGEYEFMQVLYEVEAAFILARELATIPHDQSRIQSA